MSSNHEEMARKIQQLKVERNFWAKKYFEEKERREASEKALAETNKHDPIKLPDTCVKNILDYLSGKELLTVTEVSKSWKSYIESNNPLMSRAMDQVVVKLPEEANWSQLMRPYKHMEATFPQCIMVNVFNVQPLTYNPFIGIYAESLETLELNVAFNWKKSLDFNVPISFLNLKKLSVLNECGDVVDKALLKFINSCSFPEVKSFLLIVDEDFDPDLDYRRSRLDCTGILGKFPKLRALFYDVDDFLDNPIEIQPTKPKVEVLGLSQMITPLLNCFKDTITEFYYESTFYKYSIEDVLESLRELKVLEINDIDEDHDEDAFQFQPHENLQVLQLTDVSYLQELLLKLPSLKVLKYRGTIDEAEMKFIARNMKHLEKLVAHDITENALEFHRGLKNHHDDFIINTVFECKIKTDWDNYQHENKFKEL